MLLSSVDLGGSNRLCGNLPDPRPKIYYIGLSNQVFNCLSLPTGYSGSGTCNNVTGVCASSTSSVSATTSPSASSTNSAISAKASLSGSESQSSYSIASSSGSTLSSLSFSQSPSYSVTSSLSESGSESSSPSFSQSPSYSATSSSSESGSELSSPSFSLSPTYSVTSSLSRSESSSPSFSLSPTYSVTSSLSVSGSESSSPSCRVSHTGSPTHSVSVSEINMSSYSSQSPVYSSMSGSRSNSPPLSGSPTNSATSSMRGGGSTSSAPPISTDPSTQSPGGSKSVPSSHPSQMSPTRSAWSGPTPSGFEGSGSVLLIASASDFAAFSTSSSESDSNSRMKSSASLEPSGGKSNGSSSSSSSSRETGFLTDSSSQPASTLYGQSKAGSHPSASTTPIILESNLPSINSSAFLVHLSFSPPLIATISFPSNVSPNVLVELSDSLSGGVVGALFVPPNLSNEANTTLITSFTSTIPSQQNLASAVLSITLLDGQGFSITRLDSPLTICWALLSNIEKEQRICLSYYDTHEEKWTCEDECLSKVASKGTNASDGRTGEENLLCGQTSHLTSFALLLIGGVVEDPCQPSKGDNTLSWISLGMVGGAILAVSFSVVIIELYFRWRHIKLDRELTKVCSKASMAS